MKKIIIIKSEKIQEVIKQINSFKNILKEFVESIQLNNENIQNKINNTLLNNTATEIDNSGYYDIKKSFDESKARINEYYSDYKHYKKLIVLSSKNIQIIIYFVVLIVTFFSLLNNIYVLPKYSNNFVNLTSFLYNHFILTSFKVIKIKFLMGNFILKRDLNLDDYINYNDLPTIMKNMKKFPEINDYYNNKMLKNACSALYNELQEKEKYDTCMNDKIIIIRKNVFSLLEYINELYEIILKEITLKKQSGLFYNNFELFSSNNFYDLEKTFYLYISPIISSLTKVINLSLENFYRKKIKITVYIMTILALFSLIFISYIMFFYINKIIQLLTTNRFILKIIPTIIICNTPELANWIEENF